ncbi:MAG TPA: hypothetical protein VHA82_05360 [Ramlibacter sp.]|uniref:hypothetical protein n=1 Tax=Ramlibacter sp. TaxID=1917967 RepID=UPI002CC54E9B|nr:hypothetical protein [Ramlibacter sp.]HVZ43218.1 hypothetical protein [Ramlibacter sp.]
MRKTPLIIALVASIGSLGLAGCDVKKTQEGSLTMPKYAVEKKQEGDVTLPKYDVTAPSVDVSKKEETVKVPKLTTEEKTITVPSVDVKTGQEKAAEKDASKDSTDSGEKVAQKK